MPPASAATDGLPLAPRPAAGAFADRLVAAQRDHGGPLCVGLDPALGEMPPDALNAVHRLDGAAATAAEFCRAVIDGVADVAAAVKPQSAFFEQLGPSGVRALGEVVEHAQRAGLPVILDAKRADIGSTMTAYTSATVGRVSLAGQDKVVIDADAVTANPYLGVDALEPLLGACDEFGKGAFVLVRTTNPGSGAVQQLVLADGRSVADAVADLVHAAGRDRRGASGYSSVGAVVALTHPEHARTLRARLPHALLLVPGLGVQGGRADDLPALAGADGAGVIVNASRAVARAWREEPAGDWRHRVRYGAARAAQQLVDDLRTAYEREGAWPW